MHTHLRGVLSRGDRTRTCDVVNPNHVAYQLAHAPPGVAIPVVELACEGWELPTQQRLISPAGAERSAMQGAHVADDSSGCRLTLLRFRRGGPGRTCAGRWPVDHRGADALPELASPRPGPGSCRPPSVLHARRRPHHMDVPRVQRRRLRPARRPRVRRNGRARRREELVRPVPESAVDTAGIAGRDLAVLLVGAQCKFGISPDPSPRPSSVSSQPPPRQPHRQDDAKDRGDQPPELYGEQRQQEPAEECHVTEGRS